MKPLSDYNHNYIQKLSAQCDQMGEYLVRKVHDGHVKDRLSDQLKWLQYQIKYCSEKNNFELLEENYNWVVSNFNHDLQLQTNWQFSHHHTFTRG